MRVTITVGPEAWVVTPRHDRKTPLKMPAADIAADADLPANELPGREFQRRLGLATGWLTGTLCWAGAAIIAPESGGSSLVLAGVACAVASFVVGGLTS